MRSQWSWCILAALFAAPHADAQEAIAKSKIVSVGLFKNGLVIVKREVQIPKEGTYRLDASPEAIHGTFWIESAAKVEAAVKIRDVEAPLHAESGMKLQHDLAGKKVTLTFRNDKPGTRGPCAFSYRRGAPPSTTSCTATSSSITPISRTSCSCAQTGCPHTTCRSSSTMWRWRSRMW